jgi:hypothetical protein
VDSSIGSKIKFALKEKEISKKNRKIDFLKNISNGFIIVLNNSLISKILDFFLRLDLKKSVTNGF